LDTSPQNITGLGIARESYVDTAVLFKDRRRQSPNAVRRITTYMISSTGWSRQLRHQSTIFCRIIWQLMALAIASTPPLVIPTSPSAPSVFQSTVRPARFPLPEGVTSRKVELAIMTDRSSRARATQSLHSRHGL
jgi:hypothetical protein